MRRPLRRAAPPPRSGKCFAFELDPKESPDDPEPTEVPVRVLLSVAHDGEYPEVAPPLKLRSIRGTNAADMAALEARLAQEVEDNLGALFAMRGALFAMRGQCMRPRPWS